MARRCVTVGRYGIKMARVGKLSFPVWAIKIYVLKQRKDGVWTWRLERMSDPRSGRHPSSKHEIEAKEVATKNGYEYRRYCVQGLLQKSEEAA